MCGFGPRALPMIVMPARSAMDAANVVGMDIVATTGTPARASFVAIALETRPVSRIWQSSRRWPSCRAAPTNLSMTQCRLTSSRTVRTCPSTTSAPVWTPPVCSRRCPPANIWDHRVRNLVGSANLSTNSDSALTGSALMGVTSSADRNPECSIRTVVPSASTRMASSRSPVPMRPSPTSQPAARSSRCSGVHNHRVTELPPHWNSTSTSGASGAPMLLPQK